MYCGLAVGKRGTRESRRMRERRGAMDTGTELMIADAVTLAKLETGFGRCRRELALLADVGALSEDEKDALNDLLQHAFDAMENLTGRPSTDCCGDAKVFETLEGLQGVLKMLKDDLALAFQRATSD